MEKVFVVIEQEPGFYDEKDAVNLKLISKDPQNIIEYFKRKNLNDLYVFETTLEAVTSFNLSSSYGDGISASAFIKMHTAKENVKQKLK